MGRRARFPSMLYHPNLQPSPLSSWTHIIVLGADPSGTLPSLSLTDPLSWVPLAANAPIPQTNPYQPFPCEPVYWLILGHLFQCALCLCPFTGFALPSISTQLKCKLLPSVPPMIRMGLWFFGTTEVKHFSSPHVRAAYCQRDLSLLMLTWITRLRLCIWLLQCKVTVPPSPFLYCTLWKEVPMQSHT